MPKHMPGKSKREMEAYRQFLDNMPLQPDTLEDNYKYKGDHFEGSNEDKIRTDTIVGQGYYHDDIARELPWYIKIINYFKEKLIVGLIITLIGLIGTSVNEYFQNLNTTVYSNKTDIAVITPLYKK